MKTGSSLLALNPESVSDSGFFISPNLRASEAKRRIPEALGGGAPGRASVNRIIDFLHKCQPHQPASIGGPPAGGRFNVAVTKPPGVRSDSGGSPKRLGWHA
jgi:hypothetical protein